MTLVPLRLVHFRLDAMRIGPSVLTDAGDLPGNFDSRLAGLDGEAAVRDFRRDDGLRKLADHRELITEIRVESLEPCGHADDGCAAAIGDDGAVVDILHIGRFDEGVVQILVGGVEWMIDLKGAARFAEVSIHFHLAIERTGFSGALAYGVNPRASGELACSTVGLDGVATDGAGTAGSHDAQASEAPNAISVASVSHAPAASPVARAKALSPIRIYAGSGQALGGRVATRRPAIAAKPGAARAAGAPLPAIAGDSGASGASVGEVRRNTFVAATLALNGKTSVPAGPWSRAAPVG